MAYVLSQKLGVFQICTPLLAGKAVNRPREYRMMDWRTGFCKFSPRILPSGRAKIRFVGQSPSRRDQAKFRGRADVRRNCFKTSDGERRYQRSRSAGLLPSTWATLRRLVETGCSAGDVGSTTEQAHSKGNKIMAIPAGVEPATFGVEFRRSIH